MTLWVSTACYGALSTPPEAPPWWASHDSSFWGYTDNTGEQDANFAGFGVTVGQTEVQKPTDPGKGNLGLYFTFQAANGYRQDLEKQFFFYISGTGADTTPGASLSPVVATSAGYPNSSVSYVTPFTATVDGSGNWTVVIEGLAVPQPDQLTFTFNVWGISQGMQTVTLGSWSFGEQCVPEPNTCFSAGGASLLVLLSLARGRVRRLVHKIG